MPLLLLLLSACFGGPKFKSGECLMLPDSNDPEQTVKIQSVIDGNYQLLKHKKVENGFQTSGPAQSLKASYVESKYVKALCP